MSGKIKVPGFDGEIPSCIDDSVKSVLEPITKGVGGTLGHLWNLAIGGWVEFLDDKSQLKYKFALENYAEKLKVKVDSIPKKNRIEPNIQVAMSALTDSLFCVECEELQEMFSALITSAMNSDKVAYVHPLFPSIIRRLSPIDAINFSAFINHSFRPGCCPCFTAVDGSTFKTSFILIDETPLTIKQQTSSLSTLHYLGLVELPANYAACIWALEDNFLTGHRVQSYVKKVRETLNRESTYRDSGEWFVDCTFVDKKFVNLTDIGYDLSECLR